MVTQERATGRQSICYVTTLPSTIAAFVLPTAEHLARHGNFRVVVVSNDNTGLPLATEAKVEFVRVPMTRGISLDGLKAIWQLYRLFTRERFDIVQYSTPNASLYTAIAASAARVPVRVYAQWGIRYVGFTGQMRRLFKLLEHLVCTLSTTVEPDSHGNLEFSVQEGLYPRTKGHVTWNGSAAGVDLSTFSVKERQQQREQTRHDLHIEEDSRVLGFVGRLSRDKGGNELLAAAKDLAHLDPDFYLLLVGTLEEDYLDPELLAWARQHQRVLMVGQTQHVAHHIAAMDVFTLPSYREGFGSVVIEAEAMGVPVIVTDIPGPLDAMVPDETGLVVPARDAKALRDAAHRLLHDATLRHEMGEAGAQYARGNFDREVLKERILGRRAQQASQAIRTRDARALSRRSRPMRNENGGDW